MITQNLEFNRNCGSETQDHDKIRRFPLNKTGTKHTDIALLQWERELSAIYQLNVFWEFGFIKMKSLEGLHFISKPHLWHLPVTAHF